MNRITGLALGGLLALALPVVPSTAKAAEPAKKGKKAAAPALDKAKKTLTKPSDVKASTKKLEDLAKKAQESQEEGEPTRLAPAKLETTGKQLTKDDKADKARDEAIEQIKKILPKQKDPNIRADLTFQLAELWWEKSRYVKGQEMEAYNAEADKWRQCRSEKDIKACGGEPRPNNRLSETYRTTAVGLYEEMLKTYPQYPRSDEIRFILAYNKMDLSGGTEDKKAKEKYRKEALDQYTQLIALYPKSTFTCSAYVEIGNAKFDNNELAPARKAFEEALKCKDTKVHTYATYKLGWCDYNAGDYAMAVKRFKEVVTRSDQEKGEKVRLKTEALRDLVLAFEKAGELDTAIDYYVKTVGKQNSKSYIVKLAAQYFAQGGYDYANKTYRYLMKELKNDPSAPEWQSKIVLAYDKLGNRPKVLEEMRNLVNNYKPGTEWYQVNNTAKGKPALEFAYALTEEALYNLVTDYHQEAIKTKKVVTYKLARDIYKEYIDNFPKTERSYQMRFYYAEILYALEDYQPAYDAYVIVATDTTGDQYKQVAAKNMLLAAEKLVKIEGGDYEKVVSDDTAIIDEDKAKGDISAKKIKVVLDKNAQAKDLTKLEQQFITACDKYLDLIPGAEDEAQVRLSAAVTFFDHNQYVEAANRFGFIIQKWPQEPSSSVAADLVLEALETKSEWETLNKRAREFQANAKLLAGNDDRKKKFREKLPLYVESSAFKIAQAEESKDALKAATIYRDFVKEFPKSKYSPVALYNSFLAYQNAKQLDQAIAVGEQFRKDYMNADSDDMRKLPGAKDGELRPKVLPDVTFRLAKSYEMTADFAKAAGYYETYVKEFPEEKSAPDAQFNAGLWYQGLGETAKAVAAFDKYIEIYKKKSDADRKELKLVSDATVAYSIAQVYESVRDWPNTIKRLQAYLDTYKTEEAYKRQNALYHQALAIKESGKPADFTKKCDEVRAVSVTGEDVKRETYKVAKAHCEFNKLEEEYNAYIAFKFKSVNTLQADLKTKLGKKNELSKKYLGVVEIGNGDWAIAALTRIASLPRNLAQSVREAPIPKGLDFDQQDLYKSQIEDKAIEIETPAIELYETAIKKSFELNIYNEWTLEAEKVLAEFKPDLFNEVKELPLKGSEFFFTADKAAGSGGF
jgi:tetratricopeptide (TPR) repeat protein